MPLLSEFIQEQLTLTTNKLLTLQEELRATTIDGVTSLEFSHKKLQTQGLQMQKALLDTALNGDITLLAMQAPPEIQALFAQYTQQCEHLFSQENPCGYCLILDLNQLKEQVDDKKSKDRVSAALQISRKKITYAEIQLELLEYKILTATGITPNTKERELKELIRNLSCYADLELEYKDQSFIIRPFANRTNLEYTTPNEHAARLYKQLTDLFLNTQHMPLAEQESDLLTDLYATSFTGNPNFAQEEEAYLQQLRSSYKEQAAPSTDGWYSRAKSLFRLKS